MVRKYKNDISVFILILVISLISVIRVGELPGLYLDAVNPDYLAVQVLNPSAYSSSWALPNLGIPLLGQVYHGTVTMFGSILSILVTGTTSILQLRIVNGIYGTVACYLVFRILIKLNIKKWIAIGLALALAISPNLTSMYRTQYYIELPGVIFMLLATICLISWTEETSQKKKILNTGIFAGLAFYNYFNFIFFLPGMLIVLYAMLKYFKINERYRYLVVLLSGYAMGCYLYILGYLMVCIVPLEVFTLEQKQMICGVFTILWYSVLVFLYSLQCKKNSQLKKTCAIIIFGCCTLVIIGLSTLNELSGYMTGLNVAGSKGGLLERVELIINYLLQILCYSCEEYIVLMKNVCVGLSWIPIFMAGLLIFMVYLRKKQKIEFDRRIKFVAGLVFTAFVYILLCLIMATRMQGQHFVPMLFIMYLLIGVCIDIIYVYAYSTKSKNSLNMIVTIIFGIMIFGGALNQTKIYYELKNDDDNINMCYSDAIRLISEKALSEAYSETKQYYIFPEWGYMCGFGYLTGNTIPFSDRFGVYVKDLYEQGYSVIVCFWDEDNISEYENTLISILGDQIETEYITDACWGEDAKILKVEGFLK